MSKTSLVLAAATGLATLAAGVSAASANGMHNHFFHHRPAFGIIVGSGYGYDCGYLYDRWIYTGDYYWKGRYYRCRNGW